MTDLPDFQLLFDALPTPCLALHPRGLTVVAANAAAQTAVGSAASLLGWTVPELFEFEANLTAWEAALAAVQNTGQAGQLLIRRPGPATGAEERPRRWNLTLTPVRPAPAGSVRYLLCQLQELPAGQVAAPTQLVADSQAEFEQFRFLAELIPQLVWITDAAGRYEYFSTRWTAYTGHTLAGAAVPGLWRAMIHPNDQQRVWARWRHALATGETHEIEYRFRGQDGSFRWFLSQALPQRDAAGTIVRWFGTSTDIDEHKRTRQLLEAKDRQLQQILSQVPAYIATLTGPDHVYRYVNERAQQLFSGQARIGVPAAQAAPELAHQGFITLIDDVYRTGEPFVLHEMPFRPPPVAPDSEQMFFNGVFQPLLDEQGHTQGILVFGIDVTEQVRAKQRAAGLMEEIRQQDEQFRQVLEGLPQMAWVSRPDGDITYYNQRWYDFTGGTFEELQNWGWERFTHPDDLATTRQRWQTALELGTPFETEHRWRSQAGDYRWFLARAEPVRHPDGRILRWVGTNTDINDQRRTQQRLEEKDQQLLRILGQAPAAIATYEAPDHQLAFFNSAYATLVERPLMPGRRAVDLFPEMEEQGFLAVLDNVYRTGETWMAAETVVAFQSAGPDPFRQRYVTLSIQALRDEQQQVSGLLSFAIDVTEQVRARQRSEALQAQLRRRDEQVRLMTESLSITTFISDPTGRVIYISPQWYATTGQDPALVSIDDTWRDVLHPDDLPTIEREYGAALAEGRGWSYEFRLRHHDGQYRWQLSQGVPEADAEGQVVRWYGSNTDIHEERELRGLLQAQNAELTRINEDLDNFVYTASHDLRQPIHNMAGIFEELTRTAYFRDPDAVKLIAMFERALQQIYATIHDLSDLVQLQKQQQQLATAPVALAALTAEVLASIQDQLTTSRAQVTTDFEAVPVISFGRPSLQSVLYNLISNALKYAAPGRPPRIHVASARRENQLVLTVQDNGLGIDLTRFGGQLFQLFRRFHDHVEGSGMGLYLVNRIVQSHGGRVEVASVVNEGTTFTVYLPAAEAASLAGAEQ